MKCKISLLCAGVLFANLAQSAIATDKSIYGKAHIDIGYNLQGYTNDIDKMIDYADLVGLKTRSYNNSITFGGGYNVYYRYDAIINPFIGAEATFKIPVSGQKFIYNQTGYIKIHEWFIMNAKLGAKILFGKDFALAPYFTLGFNVMQMKDSDDVSATKAGLSTGIGIEGLLSDKYSVAVEYRYTSNDMGAKFENLKAKTHNFMVKFGYHFL